jgi:hypothetical protein
MLSLENIDFLKSLNLNKDQYSKLANIIFEYGQNKYEDGCDNEFDKIW